MKIAFVGKGGSGKSSVSWLVVKTLESMGKKVLAVDADHNMDLTSLLGVDFETIPLMYKTEKDFSSSIKKDLDDTWVSILSNPDIEKIKFTINEDDEYTEKISTVVSENIKLVTVGLGDEDTLYSGKCAHGLSNPLKYYLGLLEEKDTWVVVDSVAGVDMVNFGLFAGLDAMICIVEPHINSIKVYTQIKEIARKTGMKLYIIINKPVDNEYYKSLKTLKEATILGEIPFDESTIYYDYQKINTDTKSNLQNIVNEIAKIAKKDSLSSLRDFHKEKYKQSV